MKVKICGLTTPEAVAEAASADFAGFVFYPPSPRHLTAARAAALAAPLPNSVARVAVTVDADDATLAAILASFKAGYIQLHGEETPARAVEIGRRFGVKTIKALPVAEAQDLRAADDYADSCDWLLFDARPPRRPGALPGGNAASFEWTILAGRRVARPWLLSGGLTPENVGAAIAASGAEAVDVSSGVEERPGIKSPARIRAFIEAARTK